ADAEHVVTDPETRDFAADRSDDTRHVETGNRVPGRPEAGHEARGIRQTGHQMPGAPVEAGGMNLHQHLVGSDRRLLDLADAQHVERAVLTLGATPHALPRK